MIDVLGAKRVLVLSMLVALNVLFGLIVYSYLLPQEKTLEREKRGLQSTVLGLRNNIANVQLDIEQLESQKDAFEALQERGFFEVQNRRAVRETTELARDKAGVVSAVVSFKPGEKEVDAQAAEANHVILNSAVQIDIKAISDRDVYLYIEELKRTFPGHLSITSIEIERELDVSRGVLRNIAFGDNPALISAQVVLAWRTMIPSDTDLGQGQ